MSTIDCKALAPTWETLAQDFITEPNVVIAKVDAEAENSKATASEQGVTSYPTIKFFAKGSTEGEAYTGGRTEKELIDFINEKAGTHRVPGGGLDTKGGTIDAASITPVNGLLLVNSGYGMFGQIAGNALLAFKPASPGARASR